MPRARALAQKVVRTGIYNLWSNKEGNGPPVDCLGLPSTSIRRKTMLQHCFKCEASGIKLGYDSRVSTSTSYYYRELGGSAEFVSIIWVVQPHSTQYDLGEYKSDIFRSH